MGAELWYSEKTNVSRKGTTFAELQNIFIDNITTKFIYEPIACCRLSDNSFEVKIMMEDKEFDSLGVIDGFNKKIGYVLYKDLKDGKVSDHIKQYCLEIIISDSTPISDLIDLLSQNEFLYVLNKGDVEGIVTRADINKPIVRIYLFGIISLFELHLNYWISKNYSENEWIEILSKKRLQIAQNILEQRRGNNSQLSLLECLQFCDKKYILNKNSDFLQLFQFSKSSFKEFLEKCEVIRNELAHSQNSITANLNWQDFSTTIKSMKKFLDFSEKNRIQDSKFVEVFKEK